MPSSYQTSAMERTSESCCGSEQMDCSRAGWTVDCHFGPSASQRQTVGRCRDGFGGNPGFHVRETGTTHNLEWRLQCELLRTDMRSSRGRVRCPVRTSITRCCGRAGPDGDKHLDGRKLRTGNLETRRRKWTLSRYRRKWKQDECKYWTSTGPTWITGCFLFFR